MLSKEKKEKPPINLEEIVSAKKEALHLQKELSYILHEYLKPLDPEYREKKATDEEIGKVTWNFMKKLAELYLRQMGKKEDTIKDMLSNNRDVETLVNGAFGLTYVQIKGIFYRFAKDENVLPVEIVGSLLSLTDHYFNKTAQTNIAKYIDCFVLEFKYCY